LKKVFFFKVQTLLTQRNYIITSWLTRIQVTMSRNGGLTEMNYFFYSVFSVQLKIGHLNVLLEFRFRIHKYNVWTVPVTGLVIRIIEIVKTGMRSRVDIQIRTLSTYKCHVHDETFGRKHRKPVAYCLHRSFSQIVLQLLMPLFFFLSLLRAVYTI